VQTLGAMPERRPRHLAGGPPRLPARRGLLAGGLAVVVAAVVVAVLLTGGPRSAGRGIGKAPPSGPTTATTVTTVTTATTAPPATRPPVPASRTPNLLADPGFERGLAGWTPLGGASLRRSAARHAGAAAALLARGATAPAAPGLAAGVGGSRVGRGWQASAWVRATRPGTSVTIALRESAHGRVDSADEFELVLGDTAWHQLAVVHAGSVPGSALEVAIVAPGLPDGAGVLVDDVAVRQRPAT
jgi:hypothetical protein